MITPITADARAQARSDRAHVRYLRSTRQCDECRGCGYEVGLFEQRRDCRECDGTGALEYQRLRRLRAHWATVPGCDECGGRRANCRCASWLRREMEARA